MPLVIPASLPTMDEPVTVSNDPISDDVIVENDFELPPHTVTLNFSRTFNIPATEAEPARVYEEDVTVYLIGTAHLSDESSDDVRKLIRGVQPDSVMVELCNSRSSIMVTKPSTSPPPAMDTATMIKLVRAQGIFGLFQLGLQSMYAQASKLVNLPVGGEFRAAYETATELGAKIVLGDRPVAITLKRVWAAMTFREKARLVWMLLTEKLDGLTQEDIEALKQGDIFDTLCKEFGKYFPSILSPLVTERDLFLTYMLRHACRGSTIVGVVGLGHLAGIQKHWEEPINVEALMQVPIGRSKVATAITWGVKGVLVYLLFTAGRWMLSKLV
eukprot:TRINITY_DN10929_c0_g1_i1.p1 TRINITY_DN10929_c0_g1~~TRINITY_DN10929_c0_g1_i1.p1  ORF type:complete len:329 (+),score=57.86 TRINITY_DN10929_c0_g1_i1:1167-2153(+)